MLVKGTGYMTNSLLGERNEIRQHLPLSRVGACNLRLVWRAPGDQRMVQLLFQTPRLSDVLDSLVIIRCS
jgi:hypothetical protein